MNFEKLLLRIFWKILIFENKVNGGWKLNDYKVSFKQFFCITIFLATLFFKSRFKVWRQTRLRSKFQNFSRHASFKNFQLKIILKIFYYFESKFCRFLKENFKFPSEALP